MSESARSIFGRPAGNSSRRQSAARPAKAPAGARPASSRTPSQPRRTNVYPPVVSRQPAENSVPTRRRASAPARRQYYYALSTPGAEVRLPALPTIHPSWRMLSAAIALFMTFCLFALWNAPTFQIGEIALTGNKRLTRADLEAVMKVNGAPAVTVSPASLEEALTAAFPELSQVSVILGFPANLAVTVAERQPVIAWIQDGETRWVDKDGYAFPARGDAGVELVTVQAAGSPPSLVVEEDPEKSGETSSAAAAAKILNPDQAAPFLLPEMIAPLVEISAQAPAGMPLVYSPDYGLGWNDRQGWNVYFGHNTSDIQTKLNEYQAIVDYISPRNIHPSMISVEFLHAPFYRLEP